MFMVERITVWFEGPQHATDEIVLLVLLTAGPGGVVGAGVSVDYSDLLPNFSVSGFRRFNTSTSGRRCLTTGIGETSNMPPFIDNINALSFPYASFGLGLPASPTANTC